MAISSLNLTECDKNKAYKISFKAKPIPIEKAQELKNSLLSNSVQAVDLYCHNSPDEDTINSMKVIYNWLNTNGKKVSACVNASDTKGLYFNRFLYHLKNGKSKEVPDKAVCLDFNGFERVPKHYGMAFLLNDFKNIVGFDHHSKSDTLIKSNDMYIDTSAYSCSGVIYRFFEAIGQKLSQKDARSLYCGMLSDYRGSKLVSINKIGEHKYELIKKPMLFEDKNSVEVLEKLENQLSTKDKNEIYKHLDILERLNKKEKTFMKDVVSDIQVCPSGTFGYIFIEPEDKEWASVGMDNIKTSAILKEIRTRVVGGAKGDNIFTEEQQERFKNIKAMAVFYRTNKSDESPYQMSITSKEGYAEKLINYIKENIDYELIAGGHPDRAGGRINSIDYDDVLKFVNEFITADEALSKTENKDKV